MSKRNGFTLVELMVVIVIIGVLAAVAIPKMMAATNKAKASEGPQILGTIANLEHAFQAEYNAYIELANPAPSNGGVTAASGWDAIGMDKMPFSNYFTFSVNPGAQGAATSKVANFPTNNALLDFRAQATLKNKLGDATGGGWVGVNSADIKSVSDTYLSNLVASFGAAVGATGW